VEKKNRDIRMVMAAVMLTATILAVSPVSAVDLVEGEWETITETMLEGMPFAMPAMTATQCLTKQDLLPGKDEKNGCTFSEQKISGNTVHWKVTCKDREATSEITGEITFAGKNYKGTTRVLLTDGNSQSTTMTMKLSGRYLGPCTGKGPMVNGLPLDSIIK
jgi:hypothetical protein